MQISMDFDLEGYGGAVDNDNIDDDGPHFSQYMADNSLPNNTTYLLWHGTDMQSGVGGIQIGMIDGSPSGFHFHNLLS